MGRSKPLVYVVDDDEAVRDSLRLLLKSVGLDVATYPSARSFLEEFDRDRTSCLVLDVRMPGMSGLELQEELADRNAGLPIIFITGYGDVPMAVQTLRSGAVDFIEKPFNDQALLDRIQQALARHAAARAEAARASLIRRRRDTLTPREREVLQLVVEGKANKVIAADLRISERTVEIHRARVMQKMQATSLAELVAMVLEERKEARE